MCSIATAFCPRKSSLLSRQALHSAAESAPLCVESSGALLGRLRREREAVKESGMRSFLKAYKDIKRGAKVTQRRNIHHAEPSTKIRLTGSAEMRGA